MPLFAVLIAAACAGGGGEGVNDPYEPANRRVHAFNKAVDQNVVRPLTAPFRGGDSEGGPGVTAVLSNVGGNLSLPGKVVNGLLQGRPDHAARNAGRFVVNTTLGLGGLHDPAGQEFGLHEVDTDFGETLHVWGVAEGPYMELPLIGPSTARDAFGRVVDWMMDPMDQVLNDDQALGARVIRLGSKAGERARFGDTVDSILHQSADSYAQTRLLYLQHRRYELGQEAEVIDPYDDPYDE